MSQYSLSDLWLKYKQESFFIVFLSFFYIFSTLTASAQNITNEDKIKASYVFNFIRFIEWPLTDRVDSSTVDEQNRPIKKIAVCAINRKNQFAKAFSPVVGKIVKGRKLTFKSISHSDDLSQCNLLYIDKADKNLIKQLLPDIKKHQILSISDMKAFCSIGGIIGMVTKKGKIKVEINLEVAKAAGFKINSNLLEVATIVSSQ